METTTRKGTAGVIVMASKGPRVERTLPRRRGTPASAECVTCARGPLAGGWGAALALTLCMLSAAAAAAGPHLHFELPAGDAAVMLNEFSRQSDLQVLFDYKLLKGVQTHAVRGDLDASDALKAMLAGTGLVFDFVNERTLAVALESGARAPLRRARRPPTGSNAVGDGLEQVLVSGVTDSGVQPLLGAPIIELSRADIERSGLATAQDFLRTLPQVFGGGPSEDTLLIGREASTNSARGAGVNLRGLDAGATLVLIDGRRLAPSGTEGTFTDISNIPLSAVDHIEVLPDATSARYGADAVAGVVNFVMRGSFDGAQTQARVGTVTDGSLADHQFSQLFGSSWSSGTGLVALDYCQRDALRARDRAQATSNLTRFGGDNFNTPYGTPGNITDGITYWPLPPTRSGVPLTAANLRPGPPNLYDQAAGTDITPAQERWSLFGKVNLQPAEALDLFAEALFTSRRVTNIATSANPLTLTVPSTNAFYVDPVGDAAPVTVLQGSATYFGIPAAHVHVNTGNFSSGLNLAAPYGWTVTGVLAYTFENQLETIYGLDDPSALQAALADPNPATAFDPFADGSRTNPATLASIRRTGLFKLDSSLKTVSVTGVGPMALLPAGAAELTAGAEYRDQVFDTVTTDPSATPGYEPRSDLGRRIRAGFAELRVPLFGADFVRPFARRLELSFGIRREDYSDLGAVTIPKLGFAWLPVSGIGLRGTYTKSFSPPNLPDLTGKDSFSTLLPLPDPGNPSGLTTALVRYGTNPDLRAQRARSWTLGLDVTPHEAPGLSLALTYFNITFHGRIDQPLIGEDVLSQPEFAWLVNRNVTPAALAAACSQGTYVGAPGTCTGPGVGAIIDARLNNVALLKTDGIDLLGKYLLPGPIGQYELGLTGTYVLDYTSANTPGAAPSSLLNTQNNPINLRLRGSLLWSYRGFGAAAFVNHDNGYRDTNSVPPRNVRSLTTLDLQLSYQTGTGARRWLSHAQIALNVQNLFDTYPPFLNNHIGVGYDQENGDLLGRFISVDVRKRW